MPEKQPTDSAIIKGFEKFEQGFNVAMAVARTGIPGSTLVGTHTTPEQTKEALWQAHEIYRHIATAAHERIEAKKGNTNASK